MQTRFTHAQFPRHCTRKVSYLLLVSALACATARSAAAQDMPIMPDALAPSAPKTGSVETPQYDVTSIKENKSGSGMMRIASTPDGFSGVNLSLKSYMANAFGIKQDLISGGPDWVGSMGFDLNTKVAPEDVETFKKCTQEQRRSMLQAVLAERFKLKTHVETKTLPIYELVVAKGGPKLKESPAKQPGPDGGKGAEPGAPPATAPRTMRFGPGEFTGEGLTMAATADQLTSSVHRKVVDKTGLTGRYDFKLTWTPDTSAGAQHDAGTDSAPDIFTAVQEQLGLRLQPSRGPVDALVIDHAEKPSEN